MKLIAHRGLYKNKNEQNTIASFLNAIKSPHFVGFEFDVRQTKDKEFIIHHDAFIGEQLIKKTNFKDLKLYNIPKLEEVLKLNTDKIFLVEIKDIDVDVSKLNKLLNKYKNKKIYVMSFYNQVIQNLKKEDVHYKLGSLNYVLNTIEKYPFDFICLLNSITKNEKIEKYFRLNKEVFIYGMIDDSKYIHGKKCFYITDLKI